MFGDLFRLHEQYFEFQEKDFCTSITNVTRAPHAGANARLHFDLKNKVKVTKLFSAMETLLVMLNTKHDQNLSSGSGDIAVKPIS